MTTQAKPREARRATYQDVLDAPPHKVARCSPGPSHTHPRPAMRHAWASSILGGSLVNPFSRGSGGPGGWWIVFEPELHLGADIVVPDLAGWRRETMPRISGRGVLHDRAGLGLRGSLALHAAAGPGREAGSLCPRGRPPSLVRGSDARTLEAFELREGHWLLLTTLVDDVPVSLPPFDAITFPLDALWPEVIAGAGNGEKS